MTEDMRTPILQGKGASDYERYLRTDELLALQKPPDEMLHPDELTFQVTHQASELLMKGAAWELDRARISMQQGDYRNAARLLRRANKMLVHPLRMLALLELYYRHAEFFELHDIAEELLDYDEQIQLFRYAHLKLAQRIIGGGVVGTMGTPVEVLKQRMEYPLYRQLWDVRNEITSKVNAENATGHGGAY
jgi:tryptophan 2,3-dioxygenase